jgi:hypothetical protein
VKTQQKISGRLTSDTVTNNRYAIRRYIFTASKHGADVMAAIRNAILGRPWTPRAWTNQLARNNRHHSSHTATNGYVMEWS